jgi:hypothetical protein
LRFQGYSQQKEEISSIKIKAPELLTALGNFQKKLAPYGKSLGCVKTGWLALQSKRTIELKLCFLQYLGSSLVKSFSSGWLASLLRINSSDENRALLINGYKEIQNEFCE